MCVSVYMQEDAESQGVEEEGEGHVFLSLTASGFLDLTTAVHGQ